MAFSIRQNVAQQIVEAVKDVAGHDINFIDAKGIIFASTDIKRIGDYHEIGHQVIKKGDICAVIGISGEPNEVRKYVYQAFESTDSQLYTFNYANEYILFLEAEKVEKCLYIFEKLGQKYSSCQSAKIAVESLFPDECMAVFDMLDLEILLGNVEDETKQLYLHKNTLQYRLDKIWKETGYNPRELKDAVVLYIGLKMLGND